MRHIRHFILAVLAGVFIALGGTVYLSVDNKVVGAMLFSVGLFTICTFKLNLFTGKVCYLPDHDPSYICDLFFIWLGNAIGASGIALLELCTRHGPVLKERAQLICMSKLHDTPISIFILSILCNVLIYLAVEGYRICNAEVGRYLAVFFGVSVFVLCGFEHCVANMYYFALAGWESKTFLYLLIMTSGNAAGGTLSRIFFNFQKRKEL